MGKPLSFETQLTKKRIAEEIEEIEGEVDGKGFISDSGLRRLRELRIALESKPLIGDEA